MILDCRGYPTLQVDVSCGDVMGRADVPAGRSTGSNEAVELQGRRRRLARLRRAGGHPVGQRRDRRRAGRPRRRRPARPGRLPPRARRHARQEPAGRQRHRRGVAGGGPRSRCRRLSAPASLPERRLVRAARAARQPHQRRPPHAATTWPSRSSSSCPSAPAPSARRCGSSASATWPSGEIVIGRYGKLSGNTGDEGGYATPIVDVREALARAARGRRGGRLPGRDGLRSGLRRHPSLGRRAALLLVSPGATYTTEQLIDLYRELVRDFGIVSIEDPLREDDWEGFAEVTRALEGVQIIGDDLFVTNAAARAPRRRSWAPANALLWKVNQIGTLSEAVDAAEAAMGAGYGVCVSERSGETEDPIIADLDGGAQLRTDQDRLAGARRAHGQVQPPAADRGVARELGRLRRPRLPTAGRRPPGGRRGRLRRGAGGTLVGLTRHRRTIASTEPSRSSPATAAVSCAPTRWRSRRRDCGPPTPPPRSNVRCGWTAIGWSSPGSRSPASTDAQAAGETVIELAGRRLFLVGAGKATIGMAAVPRPAAGAALHRRRRRREARPGHGARSAAAPRRGARGARIRCPTSRAWQAGCACSPSPRQAQPGDLLIGLVTGGSSALAVAPGRRHRRWPTRSRPTGCCSPAAQTSSPSTTSASTSRRSRAACSRGPSSRRAAGLAAERPATRGRALPKQERLRVQTAPRAPRSSTSRSATWSATRSTTSPT